LKNTLTTTPAAEYLARLREHSFWSEWSILIALALVFGIFGALSPHVFLTWGNIDDVLVAASILVVITVGQAIVVITAGIDLSINAAEILAGIVLGWLFSHHSGMPLAILGALGAGLAVGLVNGLVITRGRISDFIVTLGTLSAATGLTLLISNASPFTIFTPFTVKLATSGIGPIRYMVLVAAAVAVVAHVVLFHTRLGVHLLAVGGDREASASLGIATARVKLAAYMIAGLLAAIAAVMVISRVGAAEPTTSTELLLNSVAAVVLGGVSLFGGRGSIVGPVAGALVLQLLLNGLTITNVPVYWQPIAVGGVVIVSALLSRYAEESG
jgi:ribose transport system permease protein